MPERTTVTSPSKPPPLALPRRFILSFFLNFFEEIGARAHTHVRELLLRGTCSREHAYVLRMHCIGIRYTMHALGVARVRVH